MKLVAIPIIFIKSTIVLEEIGLLYSLCKIYFMEFCIYLKSIACFASEHKNSTSHWSYKKYESRIHLKPSIRPFGVSTNTICFEGRYGFYIIKLPAPKVSNPIPTPCKVKSSRKMKG
jgi:hypothetical protein